MNYQNRVVAWAEACFGQDSEALEFRERSFRFAEEAIELCQATGISWDDLEKIIRSIYAKDRGNLLEEIGGVMVTTALLCNSIKLPMDQIAERELERISQPAKIVRIRARRAAQEPGSPVVGDAPEDRSNIYTPVKKGEGP